VVREGERKVTPGKEGRKDWEKRIIYQGGEPLFFFGGKGGGDCGGGRGGPAFPEVESSFRPNPREGKGLTVEKGKLFFKQKRYHNDMWTIPFAVLARGAKQKGTGPRGFPTFKGYSTTIYRRAKMVVLFGEKQGNYHGGGKVIGGGV